jgi:lipopolysaccharide/colanic/teichoic acid biosynthesis glycosyltransferase
MTPSRNDRNKRAFDLIISVPLFSLTLPIQLAGAIAIRIRLGSPVLFRQTRPGLDGGLFEIVKFRTMAPLDPAQGFVDDTSRMTPLGRWLRATRIDELPTLWNILRGDMSLVGPRPLLPEYLELYSPQKARRHEVRPGVTGLAQVSSRNSLSWDEKLRLDIQYVYHHTLWGDLKIIGVTEVSVAKRDGISAAGDATMPLFLGDDNQETDNRKEIA